MISPRNNKGNWYLYWLIAIPIAYEVVKHMFKPEITYGDIIVIAITVPSLAILIWQGIKYWFYLIRPFKMDYQDKLPYKGKPELSNIKTIPIGISNFWLKIQPKRVTFIDRVHIRFVNEKNPNSNSPEKNDIHVASLGYQAEVVSHYHTEEDFTNGRQTGFDTPYRCAPEDSFYINVNVKATKSWNGYIIFQANRSDGHRGYAFLPLTVDDKEIQNGQSNTTK